MTILLLMLTVLSVAFYLYAFVNFQKELKDPKRDPIARPLATVIPFSCDTRSSGANPADELGSDEADVETEIASNQLAPELYQFDSVYVGSFLVVPIRRTKQRNSPRYVTDITARRAG